MGGVGGSREREEEEEEKEREGRGGGGGTEQSLQFQVLFCGAFGPQSLHSVSSSGN